MSLKSLRAYLDSEHVYYTVRGHRPAYTSPRVAAAAHVPGRELAKVVIVWFGGRLAMAVLPATQHIDLDHLRELTGDPTARLAHEDEFIALFPDCEVGGMPPFGNLYNMEVIVAEALTHDYEISFNACSHTEIMTLAYADFERLVKPRVLCFAEPTLA